MPLTSCPSVLVIYTGGTIGMIKDSETGALKSFDWDHLYKQMPVLESLHCRIDPFSFDPLIDSSDMNPSFWIRLANVIEENYEVYDGFVVLHGTDTMAYTASMLSFMLEHLNKPVVFTGSQLPMGVIRTDGRENFITSIEIATAYEDGTPIVPEVCIYFENRLFRANRTIKFNAENFDAFLSGNYPPLAEVGIHIKYNRSHILKPNFRRLKVHRELDTNVAILKLFPGITPHVISGILNIKGLKGLILETYGSGNAPTDHWFLDLLADAIRRGILIYNVTQCKEGSVDIGRYQTSVNLGRIGVIGGFDITTESALAKLMFLLGRKIEQDQIRELLGQSLRGEMTVD
ncbi:MAG TPA: L-asparaginase 1 [Bacteroidales bacterium]|nr:MAG: L-asparaginase 1 [Bacteroidetes bacterium GWE2_42_24]OFY25980.1 MAG: L-asparaginase 1 [Bacteroidetes bacterium GWF2_43_11]PKP23600.1 MAG: L-asparaginase 1 [Bacteroidetes bacterium HGW-Bacteroidetes-22]HBZ66608.1 L-asparaginase 1 [Bacteroidales bacterium]